jgi:hypothetical protein
MLNSISYFAAQAGDWLPFLGLWLSRHCIPRQRSHWEHAARLRWSKKRFDSRYCKQLDWGGHTHWPGAKGASEMIDHDVN